MVKHTKQFVGWQPTNCLSVFDHFVGLALKRKTMNSPTSLCSSIRARQRSKIVSFLFSSIRRSLQAIQVKLFRYLLPYSKCSISCYHQLFHKIKNKQKKRKKLSIYRGAFSNSKFKFSSPQLVRMVQTQPFTDFLSWEILQNSQ